MLRLPYISVGHAKVTGTIPCRIREAQTGKGSQFCGGRLAVVPEAAASCGFLFVRDSLLISVIAHIRYYTPKRTSSFKQLALVKASFA